MTRATARPSAWSGGADSGYERTLGFYLGLDRRLGLGCTWNSIRPYSSRGCNDRRQFGHSTMPSASCIRVASAGQNQVPPHFTVEGVGGTGGESANEVSSQATTSEKSIAVAEQ